LEQYELLNFIDPNRPSDVVEKLAWFRPFLDPLDRIICGELRDLSGRQLR
jgi:hypothetical protein